MLTLIAGNIVSCLLIALLITSLLILIATVMPKLMAYNFEYNIIHILALIVTGVILYTQIIMLVGAVYAKGYVSDAEDKLLSAKELLDELPDQLITYTNTYVIDTTEGQEQISKIINPIRDYLNSYILKRIVWIAIIYTILIVFFIFQANSANKNNIKQGAYNSRGRRRDYNF